MSYRKRKGITLIELLVSLGILGILLGAVFVVYRAQLRTASTQRSLSQVQTDIQQALNIMKWDLLMAGYGTPSNVIPVAGVNRTDGSDQLILQSTGFIVGGTTRWSFTMDIFAGNEIIVRRWGDERVDLQVGDRIIVMDDRKKPIITTPLLITAREPLTYNRLPAYRITLTGNVQTASGNFVYVVPGGQLQTVTYSVQNNTLLRNGQPFLNDVEDFQVSYWVDLNSNGREDANERIMNPQGINNFASGLRTVRLNLVLLSAVDREYQFPQNRITVEDHSYDIQGEQRMRRRRFYTLDVKVRNVR